MYNIWWVMTWLANVLPAPLYRVPMHWAILMHDMYHFVEQ